MNVKPSKVGFRKMLISCLWEFRGPRLQGWRNKGKSGSRFEDIAHAAREAGTTIAGTKLGSKKCKTVPELEEKACEAPMTFKIPMPGIQTRKLSEFLEANTIQ